MYDNLKNKFYDLTAKFTLDVSLQQSYWDEIVKYYSDKSRYYHNLDHLENMILELENVTNRITDFDSILFSVFYHDIIYKATAKNNEEKSAEIAKNRFLKLKLSDNQIHKISNQIIATKTHIKNIDLDTNFLLDADLAVLGKTWSEYEIYVKQIRNEYAIYPDFLYNPGRKKVLTHFLNFDEIFKTSPFKIKYEIQARQNLKQEISLL